MQIRILKVDGPTKQGNFEFLNVAYDNDGKVGSRKIPSFKYPEVFKTLRYAKADEVYEVEAIKEGDYWNWKSVAKADAAATPQKSAGASAKPVSSGQWETREERSIRQRSIVRQNAVGNAIMLLTAGAKVPPAIDQVLEYAKTIEEWVNRTDPIDELVGLENDLPWNGEEAA